MKLTFIVLGVSIFHAAAILIAGSGVDAILPPPRDIQYGATLIYFSMLSISIFPAICLVSMYYLKVAISLLCISYFVLVSYFFPPGVERHFLLVSICFSIISFATLIICHGAKRAIYGR